MLQDITIVNPDGQRAVLPSAFDVLPREPDEPGTSPIARGEYPRLLVPLAMLEPLRARIRTDAAFRARWQTAVTQVEAPNSTWNKNPTDQLACAFAACLAMVRRPNDDLGLTWTQSWQFYRDRIVTAANGWARTGRHEHAAIASALIFDCLHADLTASERTQFLEWADLGFNANGYLGGSAEVYDGGSSDDHAAKLFCALVSASAKDRLAEAYARTMLVVDTNDWMGFGFGIGREGHEGNTLRHGLPFEIYALKHAGGYSDAETVGRFTTYLRDSWHALRHAIVPHPSVGMANGAPWTSDKFHTQDPIKAFHRIFNVGATMAWALAILPGRLDLNAAGMSDQPTLANSETDFFGYLQSAFTESFPLNPKTLRDVLDVTLLGKSASTHVARFWAFPAWLIHGAQEWSEVSEADAGIPQVRRYWPGTLDWTFINSPDFSRNSGSVIRYTHRRYGCSDYEEGTKQNGRWHVHRDGPLLIQRGETGHGVTTRRAAWCANGVLTFIDPNAYPLFTYNAGNDQHDLGGIRSFSGKATRDKDRMLVETTADYGQVTAWYADDRVVAITSDLTRSYNSTEVQYGPAIGAEPKIAKFIREFIVIRRGADGTDREKVFTYDRIVLTDPKFVPHYNLCPAADPQIEGVESEVLPWGPDQNDPAFDWYATGPTHWDYDGATRLIYDNRAEPKVALPGNGKVCVTWLEPSKVKVRKAGGFNAVSKSTPKANGYPFFSPWRGWNAKEEWSGQSALGTRAYTGLSTVTVAPAVVSLDTRFLMACEVMDAAGTPGPASVVPCDPSSVAARCGASVVVFAKDSERGTGWVDVPDGVALVAIVNLRNGGQKALTVTDAGRMEFTS